MFEQRVQSVQPGFKLPDLRPKATDIGRDQIKESFWLKMAREMYREASSAAQAG